MSEIPEDQRLTRAREIFAPYRDSENVHVAAQAALDLLDFAEERVRVNVGLLNENNALKARLRAGSDAAQPPTLTDVRETLLRLLSATDEAIGINPDPVGEALYAEMQRLTQ